MVIDEIETPAVLIEAEILDRNLRAMAGYCGRHGLSLRPHTKTHKIPQIAKLQLEYGAPGITVAKLSEAEVMANAGISDILVVYPLWGEQKWRRLAELAKRIRIAVTMDSLAVAEGISRYAHQAGVEVGIRLEFDTGFGRCGLPLESESAAIAQRIRALPNLRWEGISFYPGHIMEKRALSEDIVTENRQLDRLYSLLDDAGVPYPLVSGGNTPAACESHQFHGVTEIRPGTYVFNDRNTVDAAAATWADCAATVLATVVSTSVNRRAIIDAGSKMFSGDQLLTGDRRHFGYILDHPDLILEDLSEEHGHLLTGESRAVQVGDRLRVVPNHICPCINLQDQVYLLSGNQVLERWPVAARGKVT